jgi:hypothetical protein
MADIIDVEDFEEYYRCKRCCSKLLVKIYDDRYIGSSDFLPEFPGWCFTCLVEHCCRTDCNACKVKDKEDCSFSHIKDFYLSDED